jgi:hypothetical protein
MMSLAVVAIPGWHLKSLSFTYAAGVWKVVYDVIILFLKGL